MGDYEKILVTALVGIIAAFIGYQLRRAMEKYDARRAQEELCGLLYGFLDRLIEAADNHGAGYQISGRGVWYYMELADVLSDLCKKHHIAIGGENVFVVTRLVSGLRLVGGNPETARKIGYEIDEIIRDSSGLAIAMAEKCYKNDYATRKRLVAKNQDIQRLMTFGIRFEPFDPPLPDSSKPKKQPD